MAVGTKVTVLVRPEQLGIRSATNGDCRLIDMSFLGSSFAAHIRGIDGSKLIVTVSPDESIAFNIGESVEVFQRGPPCSLSQT